jgi:hypothetical protein
MAETSKIEAGAGNKKPPNAGKGKPKGAVNKTTALLKEAVIMAAEQVGNGLKAREHKKGLVEFLKVQAAKENNAPFMALMGKVLPTQVNAEGAVINVVIQGPDAGLL